MRSPRYFAYGDEERGQRSDPKSGRLDKVAVYRAGGYHIKGMGRPQGWVPANAGGRSLQGATLSRW
ncbi:hypothetical protein ACJJIK_13230 [Microbulbifer sp. ZKSA006]|uniref:hypothetical protein n=1 Tax=Microbulbifer sp. ZKSA006 TaxID=3243390 RepID=UPI0040395324